MTYKSAALGLGIFSLALGAAEIFAARRITRALESEGNENLVRAYGLREIVAGIGLLGGPAHATRVWNRVAGDGLDLATLGLAARKSPRNGAVWGSIAFVVGATILDLVVARGLDGETGKTLPGPQGGAPGGAQPAAA